jgi:hypothetical protein
LRLGAQVLQFLLQTANTCAIRFDCFDQTVEGRMEVVVPRISEGDGQLRSGVTDEIEILLFVQHLFYLAKNDDRDKLRFAGFHACCLQTKARVLVSYENVGFTRAQRVNGSGFFQLHLPDHGDDRQQIDQTDLHDGEEGVFESRARQDRPAKPR